MAIRQASLNISPHSANVWYVPVKKDDDDIAAAAGKFTPGNDSSEPTEKRVSSVDTSAKYVGGSAFDDTYVY
ncbi:hypothetical protein Bca52824_055023 [Brassica carinata]|uniref:Uncharacterized protein n=1 Tax=Brassica carinata TaxID=52824 RepID=A0A8X7RBM9_BRACI|nr:hypothetical protein Bca52824_055023 [Brassica carinata]